MRGGGATINRCLLSKTVTNHQDARRLCGNLVPDVCMGSLRGHPRLHMADDVPVCQNGAAVLHACRRPRTKLQLSPRQLAGKCCSVRCCVNLEAGFALAAAGMLGGAAG